MHSPRRPPIPIETLLLAYRSGIFPMADAREDNEVFWVEPRDRAIIPLGGLHISKSLRKAIRQDRYRVTLDHAFERVIRACAAPRPGHPESWISERIVASYVALHEAGHAHSIECWSIGENGGEELVGGLYGVAFDQVFCGESMFSRADNSSKVALAWLVALLRMAGFRLLDCQFMTDHLASMGAIEMPQRDYLNLVDKARGRPRCSLREAYYSVVEAPAPAAGLGDPDLAAGVSLSSGSGSSPGKRIAQSLTQTS
jgi:leucyl/phenylalanyl-tRNA--protein transferase